MNETLTIILDLLEALYREKYFAKKMWRKVYGFRDLPDEYIVMAFALKYKRTAPRHEARAARQETMATTRESGIGHTRCEV